MVQLCILIHYNMGTNDPRDSRYEESQLTQDHSNGLPRVAYISSDGQDAYRRSSARSMRRSRAERASYLLATGHLDPEEAQYLNTNSPSSDYIRQKDLINNDTTEVAKSTKPRQPPPKSPGINHHAIVDYPAEIFSPNILRSNSTNETRGKFKQTYTEVTLPMKTSPAFEYILKDNKRRNRRCCLWLLYSILVTICLAIIIFCITRLAYRYNLG